MKLTTLLIASFLFSAGLRAETNSHFWSGFATNTEGKLLATITVDTSEVPELNEWGQRAGKLCVEWYPKIAGLLASDGFNPAEYVRVKFHKDMKGVASTSRNVINISANFVKRYTNDFGMVIHELTHVVQDYRQRRNPGWLVEGVADYIRLTHFEPEARRPRINPEKAKYTDAYKTTAIFLEWTKNKYSKDLVTKLNSAMREGVFKTELFEEITARTVDELWKEFIDSVSKENRANKVE